MADRIDLTFHHFTVAQGGSSVCQAKYRRQRSVLWTELGREYRNIGASRFLDKSCQFTSAPYVNNSFISFRVAQCEYFKSA